jgi:hypothetical protein
VANQRHFCNPRVARTSRPFRQVGTGQGEVDENSEFGAGNSPNSELKHSVVATSDYLLPKRAGRPRHFALLRETSQDRLLGMQTILSLIKDRLRVRLEHFLGDFLAPVSRKTV